MKNFKYIFYPFLLTFLINSVKVIGQPIPAGALDFDGTNDYVDIGTWDPFSANGFTVEAWVYADNFGPNNWSNSIITQEGATTSIVLRAGNSGRIDLSYHHAGGYSAILTSPNTLSLNQWQHVAAVWDGSDLLLYVDGNLIGSTPSTLPPKSSPNPIYIGKSFFSGRNWNGKMDEVKIWDRALCEAEITAGMECERAGTEMNLKAYYNFNSGNVGANNSGVTTLTDVTANNNDGTLTNFALSGLSSNWIDGSANGVSGNCVPQLIFTAPADLCLDASVQTGLGGGTPIGGTYFGPGVTDDGNGMTYSFDPAAAMAGIHTIQYTYPAATSNNGFTFTTGDNGYFSDVDYPQYMADDFIASNSGNLNIINWTGMYAFDDTPPVSDNFTINIYSDNSGPDALLFSQNIGNTVNRKIEAFKVSGFNVHSYSASINFNVTQGTTYWLSIYTNTTGEGDNWAWTSKSSGNNVVSSDLSSWNPSTSSSQDFGITIIIPPCLATASDNIEVFSLPTVSFTAPADLCVDAGAQTGLGGGMPSGLGGVYSGPGVTDDGYGMTYSFDPAAAGVGVHTITYDYTDTNGCTNSASDNVEVFAVPVVTFTAPVDACLNNGLVALTGGSPSQGTVPGDNGVYSGMGVIDNGDGTYDLNPAAAGSGMHTLTYEYTDGNSCISSASDMIEVFGLSIVAFTALNDLCLNAGLQTGEGTGTGTPYGGVYTGAGVIDNGDGMTYDFDPATAGVGTHTITYSFTDANGCMETAEDVVEVIALPDLLFTALADACIDAGLQSGSGATPSGGVYSGPGVTDGSDGMNYSFDPAAAGLGTHMITYSYTDATTGCTNTKTDNVVVFALPVVLFTAPADLCVDAGVQASLGGGTSTGGVYSGPGVTDDANGVTYSFDPAVAGVGTHTITYAYTDGNGCMNSASDDVEVFGLPVVNFSALADLCIDEGVQTGLGGALPQGGVYSGAGVTDDGNGMTYSFDPASVTAGIHALTYTFSDANGCSNSTSDVVEVFALPVVTFTGTSAVCINEGVQTGLSGGSPSGAGGVYSGSGVTDDGDGMTFSFNPIAVGAGMHTLTYSYTDGNGCANSDTDIITVYGVTNVNFTTTLSDLCENAGVQSGLGGGLPSSSGGVYSGEGVTDGGDGLTFDFDPATAGAGTHTITYSFTDANGCTFTATDDVVVLPLPALTFTAPSDLCIDAGTVIVSGATPAGGTYSGTGVTESGGVYSFDPAAAGVGTHTITYDYTDGNGCSASVSDDVEVFALPVVSFTAPIDICIDSGVQIGLGGGMPSGSGGVYSGPGVTDDGNGMTYSFDPAAATAGTHTITYTFTDVNGCSASSSDDVEVLVFPSGGAPISTTYNVNTAANPAVGGICGNPGIDGTYDCAFDNAPPISLGDFTDTNTPGSTLSNIDVLIYGACSGDVEFFLNGVSIASGTATGLGCSCQSIASDPNIPQTYMVTMTPAIQAAFVAGGTNTISVAVSNSAAGAQCFYGYDITIDVGDSAFVTLDDLCVDAGVQAGLDGATPTGGVYSGTGVIDDGNGMTYSFDPAAAGVGVHTVTYDITASNGCSASFSDDVEVFALPVVSFTPPLGFCIDAGVQAGLGGATPAGGVYSGSGVTDNGNGTYDFDPAGVGVGSYTLIYTYTDGNSCTAASSGMTDVFALPTVAFSGTPDFCVDAGVQSGLSGGSPAMGAAPGDMGVYSGAGVTDNGNGTYDFDPAVASAGPTTLTYTYTDGDGCDVSANDEIVVFGLSIVTFSAPSDLCIEAGVQSGLTGGTPSGGIYGGPGITDNGDGTYDFDPSAAGAGVHTISYTHTDGNSCTVVKTNDVEVIVCHTFAAAFETTWEVAAGESITIPTNPGFSYNYTVDWGDGTMTNHSGDATHTYSSAGVKVVKIDGDFPAIYFNNTGDKDKIRAVIQWGDIAWESMERAFAGVTNFYVVSSDDPDLSGVTNMSRMFFNATNFNQFSNIDSWDVSNVTDMSAMFQLASNYNGNIDNWNVSNVENMSAMFAFASAFNRDISSWDVSSVTDMSSMFTLAGAFDQNLGGWDVEMVTTMKDMLTLSGLSDSNYDNTLIGWESQAVQNGVELGAISLKYCDSDVARTALINSHSWNITGDAKSCPIIGITDAFVTTWETTTSNEEIKIPTAGGGFDYTVDWGDGITTSGHATYATHIYSAPGLYTVKITGLFPQIYMQGAGASKPKLKSIEKWGDNEWRNMNSAFASAVNVVNNATDIPNTSFVKSMAYMFYNAKQFDADLGSWNIKNVTSMTHALSYAALSTSNYDNTLIGWGSQSVKSGVRLDARTLEYCSSIVERGNLIGNSSWTINGDSQCPLQMKSISNQIATLNGEEIELSTTTFEQVKVYPNPTNGELTMVYDLSTDQEVEILVRDVTGKLLYKVEQQGVAGENQATLNLSAYKNGMYLLQLTNGEQSLTKRVVKQ